MRLVGIRLQNFRNIAEAALELDGPRTFFIGRNGQGKTNLLEAIGYVTALRAFRPGDNRALIREGAPEAALGFRLAHESHGESEVIVRIRPRGKEAELDGTPVRRLADFIGRFPTVLFASEDIQLIRGGPALRRRLLDLHLSSLDPGYLEALQAYHRGLDHRNRLLKEEASAAQLAAFERVLAPAAAALVARRRAGIEALATLVTAFHHALAGEAEVGAIEYRPDVAAEDTSGHLDMLERQRPRDALARATQRGPHRDDLLLRVGGRDAATFASEGQQRALVLALRFAQLRDLRTRHGVAPIALADDVLGELDPERRRRFWAALEPDLQLFATGTEPPAGDDGTWTFVRVEGGCFEPGFCL